MAMKNKEKIEALEAALVMMLEVQAKHLERIEWLERDRVDDEEWIEAVSDDIDRLFNVVDPHGKREGSPGWKARNGEEAHETDEKLPELSFLDQLLLLLKD